MREIIRNNSKFIIVMLIVIILGIVGVTVAIKIGSFNPIGLNVGTATIEANIPYDSTVNEGAVTSIGKLYPIADSKVTGIDVSNDNVIKVKFMVTGKSTNPANTIYDVALRNIKMVFYYLVVIFHLILILCLIVEWFLLIHNKI